MFIISNSLLMESQNKLKRKRYKNIEINKIYNMDCLDGMKKFIDSESIDLTVTSPPYDNLRNYNGYSFDFKGIANELYRITKQGGIVVWISGDATIKGSETGTSFKQALYFMDIGFNLHDTMIYAKNGCPFPETNRYYPSFEYMFVLSKGKPRTTNLIQDKPNKGAGEKIHSKGRNKDGSLTVCSAIKNHTGRLVKEFGVRTNIWLYNVGKWNTTKDECAYKHPAMFPEQLANDHILSWSNEGDIVLDPFMGSGTTAKMAKINNRNYIGFEISKEYCDIAEERLHIA